MKQGEDKNEWDNDFCERCGEQYWEHPCSICTSAVCDDCLEEMTLSGQNKCYRCKGYYI